MSKTSVALVEYAKSQLGLPYWMGTFGQIASETIYNYNRIREQTAKYYKDSDFPSQYGKRVHDCIGLVKGYLWSETPTSPPVYCNEACEIDYSADSMLEECDEKGTIDTIPDIPGVLVFLPGHIGVYIGDGEVIEARGHRYGIVQTRLAERGWKHWGKCPYITYESEENLDMTKEELISVAGTGDNPSDWAKEATKKMKALGVFNGDGQGNYGWQQPITREAVAVVLANFAETTGR